MTQGPGSDRRSLVHRMGALLARRELLVEFTKREVRVRYKQAFLGMAWALVMPFALMAIWMLIRKSMMGGGDEQGVNAMAWLYCGLVVWTMNQTALKGCTTTLVTNKNLLSKVYFPREIFPLAKIGAAMVDFAVGLGALFILMGIVGADFHPQILLLPVPMLMHGLLLVGFGMVLGSANLFFRDVQYIFDVFILIWMFASPVFRDLQGQYLVGGSFDILKHGNPLHPVLTTYRDVLLYGEFREPEHTLYGFIVCGCIFLIGLLVFSRVEPKFAERV